MRKHLLAIALALPALRVREAAALSSDKTWLAGILQQNAKAWIAKFVRADGSVYAKYFSTAEHPNSSISEGQSYALLMAYHINDRATFDRVWHWTKLHMQILPGSKLLSWWISNPTTDVYKDVKHASAYDGEEDIAYVLLKAGERWQRADYLQEGRAIAADLFRVAVHKLQDGRYYFTGQLSNGRYAFDPSYQAPYIYEKFARYDSANATAWKQLSWHAIAAVEACTALSKADLPPQWCALSPDGKMSWMPVDTSSDPTWTRDYKSDAYRVFWRFAETARLGSESAARAVGYLQRHRTALAFLRDAGGLPEAFGYDGRPLPATWTTVASKWKLAISAALIAQNDFSEPARNRALYQSLLQPDFKGGIFGDNPSYYAGSVVWNSLRAVTLTKSDQ